MTRATWMLRVVLCGGLLLAIGGPLAAQQPSSIIGKVSDETGAVLPGVSVTATSPALQVQQIASVTDENGEYRLSPLPIGTYAVRYELSGFQTVERSEVRLTVGFTATIDTVLKISA